MKARRIRRSVAGVALTATVVLTSAGPAFAHFCRRTDFNAIAAAHAGGSKAWMTAAEWRAEVLPFISQFCPSAVAPIEAVLAGADQHTLFMGPGLLAGGTLKTGNTPEHFAYMHSAFANC